VDGWAARHAGGRGAETALSTVHTDLAAAATLTQTSPPPPSATDALAASARAALATGGA